MRHFALDYSTVSVEMIVWWNRKNESKLFCSKRSWQQNRNNRLLQMTEYFFYIFICLTINLMCLRILFIFLFKWYFLLFMKIVIYAGIWKRWQKLRKEKKRSEAKRRETIESWNFHWFFFVGFDNLNYFLFSSSSFYVAHRR